MVWVKCQVAHIPAFNSWCLQGTLQCVMSAQAAQAPPGGLLVLQAGCPLLPDLLEELSCLCLGIQAQLCCHSPSLGLCLSFWLYEVQFTSKINSISIKEGEVSFSSFPLEVSCLLIVVSSWIYSDVQQCHCIFPAVSSPSPDLYCFKRVCRRRDLSLPTKGKPVSCCWKQSLNFKVKLPVRIVFSSRQKPSFPPASQERTRVHGSFHSLWL